MIHPKQPILEDNILFDCNENNWRKEVTKWHYSAAKNAVN